MSVTIRSQHSVPFSRPCLDPVSITSPTPLRTSPTCSVSQIGPDHIRLDPLDLILSHSKLLSKPQSAQPYITSGMQRLSQITWSSRDDRATTRHPRRLVGRPPSRQSWDGGSNPLSLQSISILLHTDAPLIAPQCSYAYLFSFPTRRPIVCTPVPSPPARSLPLNADSCPSYRYPPVFDPIDYLCLRHCASLLYK